MNQKTAPALKNSGIRLENIPFSEIPGQSSLFLDFQKDSPELESFYPEKNNSLKEFSKKVLENYKIDRQKLCDVLYEENKKLGGNVKTLVNIETLRGKDCLAVVTGQQAGLFSGPVYTIYKALSTVKMVEQLSEEGIKAVPVFWIAEEDHDFDEVKKTIYLNRSGNIKVSKFDPDKDFEDVPVGYIELDDSINKVIEALFKELPRTEYSKFLQESLEKSYQNGETFSNSFARFLSEVFSDYGLIMVSPLNPELKKLCWPIFSEAFQRSDEIIQRILEKNEQLKKGNYHSQVLVEENSFPFFLQNNERERLALRKNLENEDLIIQKTKESLNRSELYELAKSYPQALSPNALLRPVVQDFLFPTLTYFGGAAEIAYFAQNSAIYEVLERPVTPIRHRAAFSIVSGKNRRNLNEYNLGLVDLFKGQEKTSARIVEEFLSNDVAVTFEDVERSINNKLDLLEKSLKTVEPTLSQNLSNRRKKIDYHLDSLRKKYHRAEIKKDEIFQRRIKSIYNDILPSKGLQERSLNVINFLNIYGDNFIKWVYESIDLEEKGHQVIIF